MGAGATLVEILVYLLLQVSFPLRAGAVVNAALVSVSIAVVSYWWSHSYDDFYFYVRIFETAQLCTRIIE